LVADPASVSTGVYYAFYKHSDGCYSAVAAKLTLVCDIVDTCSAPQNPTFQRIVSGLNPVVFVNFDAAQYPPPGNSYVIKRRRKSDPDVPGSYTTLPTPVYNSSLNKWRTSDTSTINYQFYVYKFISNCTDSSPFILADYGNFPCPTPTVDIQSGSITQSMFYLGTEDVNKFVFELWNDGHTQLLDTVEKTYPFAAPLEVVFDTNIEPQTTYETRIRMILSGEERDCPFVKRTTPPAEEANEAQFALGTIGLDICGSEMITLYYTGVLSEGTSLYIDSNMTQLVNASYTQVLFQNSNYYELNSGTVGTQLGSC
jgi:hypothetical protein